MEKALPGMAQPFIAQTLEHAGTAKFFHMFTVVLVFSFVCFILYLAIKNWSLLSLWVICIAGAVGVVFLISAGMAELFREHESGPLKTIFIEWWGILRLSLQKGEAVIFKDQLLTEL